MFINLFILSSAGLLYGWDKAMYSLFAYFVIAKMIDVVLKGLDESYAVMIVTNEHEEVTAALNERLHHEECIRRAAAREPRHGIKVALVYAHRAPRRTEHHLSPFGSRFVRMCPARIGGHTCSHGKRCIRHRADDGLMRICRLDCMDRKPRDDGEDKCAPLEVRRRLPHGGCSRRRLDGENEQINTGQKGFCPYLRTYTVFAHEFIAAHCFVL